MPRLPTPPPLRLRLLVPVLAVLAVPAACGDGGKSSATPPRPAVQVVATLPPLGWLADRIGGGRVDAEVLLPVGTSPHTWEPSPRSLRALEGAELLLTVGHPDLAFESHQVARLSADREEMTVVSMTADGTADGADPHLWTAPRHLRTAARRLSAALERLDPSGTAVYRRNLAALEAELDALDRELERRFSELPRRTFYVQHPAWGHLAAQYGLRQVALEEEGKEPSPRELVERIREARRRGVAAVFVQRGEPRQAARVFAAETGAEVVELDPLAYDWLTETRRTAAALEAALEDASGPSPGNPSGPPPTP